MQNSCHNTIQKEARVASNGRYGIRVPLRTLIDLCRTVEAWKLYARACLQETMSRNVVLRGGYGRKVKMKLCAYPIAA